MNTINLKTAQFIAIVILLVALLPLPYGYYTFTRICICLLSGIMVYKFWEEKLESWMWTFIIIAILFNPIFPIYLGKGLWALIDLVTAGIILASISKINKE